MQREGLDHKYNKSKTLARFKSMNTVEMEVESSTRWVKVPIKDLEEENEEETLVISKTKHIPLFSKKTTQ